MALCLLYDPALTTICDYWEDNGMGETRDLLKKIQDIKEIFHVRMGTIKDRKDKSLTEAEEIKKK